MEARHPQLSGGISHQPPRTRLPSQVPYAVNGVPSVVTAGISKRPGSSLLHSVGSTNPTDVEDVYRIAPFIYAASERYVVQYGTTSSSTKIRVWDRYAPATADEATVTISTDAQIYLDSSPTVDRLRFVAMPDRGYFVNTEVTPLAESAETIGATGFSVANPTVVTTSAAHGLQTGDYVNFSGSTTTPTVDGLRQVTVTSSTTFTVPVNVTVTGTATYTIVKPDYKTMPVKITRTAKSLTSQAISAIDTGTDQLSTASDHGLTTGQQIVISGANTTPSINGTQTVTVVSSTAFTIGVNITAVTTTGSFVAKALFAVDAETWPSATNGTSTSNPHPPFITNAKKIRDVAWERNRLWVAAGEYVVATDAANGRNFYYTDATNIVDSDRIWVTLGRGIADIDYLVPINKAVLAFSRTGVQYEISTREDLLNQSTVVSTSLTRLVACSARPTVINQNVYFCVENSRTAELREMQYDPISLPTTAEDVSAHASELMFLYKPQDGNRATIKSVVASGQNGAVFVFRTRFSSTSSRGSDVFDYRTRFDGDQRIQSAWGRHTFADSDGNEYLMDICVDGNDLILLRGYDPPNGSTKQWYIEAMPVLPISSHSVT